MRTTAQSQSMKSVPKIQKYEMQMFGEMEKESVREKN
jgi:hypothetical protein